MKKNIRDILVVLAIIASSSLLFFSLYEMSYMIFPEGTLGR